MPALSKSLLNDPVMLSDLIASADDSVLLTITHSPQGYINPNASIKVFL